MTCFKTTSISAYHTARNQWNPWDLPSKHARSGFFRFFSCRAPRTGAGVQITVLPDDLEAINGELLPHGTTRTVCAAWQAASPKIPEIFLRLHSCKFATNGAVCSLEGRQSTSFSLLGLPRVCSVLQ